MATFVCVTGYFKGEALIYALKEEGHTVLLITGEKLREEPWPHDAIDEAFYMQENPDGTWDDARLLAGVAWLMRERAVDRFVALDDFDVERTAHLREHFRTPGMGGTTARYFRDKLAMRERAAGAGIPVPPFVPLFNDAAIGAYTERVAPPWMVKPRSEASATGIKKMGSADELWSVLGNLGDDRHRYLLEQFAPGDVYHVDALSHDGEVIFCRTSRYLAPPFDVAHGGGVFRTVTTEPDGDDDRALQVLVRRVLKEFGLRAGASHTEFIKRHDTGEFYFLETSGRVGGAHIAEMVEVASGVNLWREWARLESALVRGEAYQLPEVRHQPTGLIVSLSRFEHPDYGGFPEPEIRWRMQKKYHVGVIVSADRTERVHELLDDFAGRIRRDYHASAPPAEKTAH
ncbi:MAG: ATPase [Catalinimonas sp.]